MTAGTANNLATTEGTGNKPAGGPHSFEESRLLTGHREQSRRRTNSAGGPRSFEEVQPERVGGQILLADFTPWGVRARGGGERLLGDEDTSSRGFHRSAGHVGSGDLTVTPPPKF